MNKKILVLLIGTILNPALVAMAQPTSKVPRVGFLSQESGRSPRLEAFRQGMRELGYVEGQNVIIESGVQRTMQRCANLELN